MFWNNNNKCKTTTTNQDEIVLDLAHEGLKAQLKLDLAQIGRGGRQVAMEPLLDAILLLFRRAHIVLLGEADAQRGHPLANLGRAKLGRHAVGRQHGLLRCAQWQGEWHTMMLYGMCQRFAAVLFIWEYFIFKKNVFLWRHPRVAVRFDTQARP